MSPDLPIGPSHAIGNVRRLLVLRSFPPFAEVSPDVLAAVAQYARERSFGRGAQIYREGSPVTGIHFIVDGEVEMRRHGRALRTLGPRSAVGGLGVFAQEPEGYDCISLTDTLTLEIGADDLQDIFEDHFVLVRASLRGLAHEILTARRRLGTDAGYSTHLEPSPACPAHELDLVERMAFIRRAMSFARSRLDAVADLAREADEIRHQAGEVLWRQGDPSDHILQLVCGSVECTSEGAEHRFRLGPGHTVGGLDALAETSRWYTATTLNEVVSLRIPSEALFDVFEDNADMARDFLRLIARDLIRLYEQAADMDASRLSRPRSEPPQPGGSAS